MKNTFGQLFNFTSFGESHGPSVGVVIDGCPAGLDFDQKFLQSEMDRRRPGQNKIVSGRNELDQVEIISGVFEGKTLGTPIAILVRNKDAKSEDYDGVKTEPRNGHADDVWKNKFGHFDHRGGGRSSGRETVARVMAGAVAKMLLAKMEPNLRIRGFSEQIGPFKISDSERTAFLQSNSSASDFTAGFVGQKHIELETFLTQAKSEGESYGGKIGLVVQGVPAGLGQPVFHKLKSDLASALMSIGAVIGFSLDGVDEALSEKGTVFHSKNLYSGIRGGISTGENLSMHVVFKPTSSILDLAKKGRHDPCIVPRAIPVVEAMVACVLVDHLLWKRTDQAH